MSESRIRPSELASTYSIVALDQHTGQLGVAVQSHWFSVGSLVCWAEAGVGAVATQAMVNVDYGPLGLQLMREGDTAAQALAALLNKDEGRAMRQVAMLDVRGYVATHTGERCIAAAGHYAGEGYSVQANMMESATVWPAMAAAFERTPGDLATRMLSALDAAQSAGGDVRGRQSAAMRVVSARPCSHPWRGIVLDLRVEDHPDPLVEMGRLLKLHEAYQHMNLGDELLGQGQVEDALKEYGQAAALAPGIAELPFWHAVTLADVGRVAEACELLRQVFAADPALARLLPRLSAAGMLRDDPQLLADLLSVQPS